MVKPFLDEALVGKVRTLVRDDSLASVEGPLFALATRMAR